MYFNLIQDDSILEGDAQVASGSKSLPDHETEEQRLEREKNESDVPRRTG